MIKQTVTYEDFEGNEVTEDLYFNLSKSEAIGLQLHTNSILGEDANPVAMAQNTLTQPLLYDAFKQIIVAAYGEKRDKTHFVKSPETATLFASSLACDALLVDLMSGKIDVRTFVRGMLPKGIDLDA